MKNTFKRIAAIALAVLLCVSTVVPALAAGNACPGYGNTHNAYNCTYLEAAKQDATCDNAGFVTGKCTTCSTVFSVSQTEALGHDWETQPTVCGNDYTKKCKVCGDEEVIPNSKVDHLYTAWTLTGGVTACEPDARIIKTCVYCGDEQTELLGDEGHKFVLVSYTAPASCLDMGVAKFECIVDGCNATKEAAVYPEKEDHHFVAWDAAELGKDANAKKATCEATGRASMICEDCDLVVKVVVAKTAHDLKDYEAKPAECEVAGNIEYSQCRVCKAYFNADGDEIEKADTVIPAIHDVLAETAANIVEFVVPDCIGAGYVTYKCNVGAGTDDACEYEGEKILAKYEKHVYYNDVKDLDVKKDLLVALGVTTEVALKTASDAKVEELWAELGEVKAGVAGNDSYVWKNYVPATCEENAKVTYKCLNYTYNYKTGAYVFSACEEADETTLSGEGFDKLVHKFAEKYPLSYTVVEGKAGTNAWTGTEATCTSTGNKVYTCINEILQADGTYAACPGTKSERLSKLGHNYVAITADDVDADADYFEANGDELTAAALKARIESTTVTCKADGKAYKVCDRCNTLSKEVTDVKSTKTEHVWTYFDNAGTPYESLEDAKEAKGVTCVDSFTVLRACSLEGCKASIEQVSYTFPAAGHVFPDTTDAEVVEYIIDNYTPVEAGSCENGALYALKCENCNVKKSFEITEGFGGGHKKVYLPGTAKAPTCNAVGYSNKWYCQNESCEYYAFVGTDKQLYVDADTLVDLANLKSDKEYGTTHQIFDATLGDAGEYREVTYKDVPDTAVSGAKTFTAAAKVVAPNVDGKYTKTVAIEGTSLVWVYAYEAKDHTEINITSGDFFCPDCDAAFDIEEHVFTKDNDLSVEADCHNAGYEYWTCNGDGCFAVEIKGFSEPVAHENGYYFVTYEDGKYSVTSDDVVEFNALDKDTIKNNGLNYVATGCTVPGYAIDKCQLCEEVVTVAIPTVAHENSKGEVLIDSCLNYVTSRTCRFCRQSIAKSHVADENGICKVCGLSAE